MPLMRLFWAVNLPPEVRAVLAGVQRELKEARADAKWVEEENLHLTVQFLGDVPAEQVPALVAAVRKTVVPGAFVLGLAGLGFFPDARAPRVLWAGVDGARERLHELHRGVSEAMAAQGFPARGRFSPHLTLARLRSSRGAVDLARLVEARAGGRFGSFTVSSVELMQSVLSRRGPSYAVLAGVNL